MGEENITTSDSEPEQTREHESKEPANVLARRVKEVLFGEKAGMVYPVVVPKHKNKKFALCDGVELDDMTLIYYLLTCDIYGQKIVTTEKEKKNNIFWEWLRRHK